MARADAMDKRERQSCAISKRPITRERSARTKKKKWHEKIGMVTAAGRARGDGEAVRANGWDEMEN